MRIAFLMIGFFSLASMAEENYDNWEIVETELNGDPLVFTYTTNESGSKLGAICLKEKGCTPYVSHGFSCKDGGEYPFLVSVDEGIVMQNLECFVMDQYYFYLMPQAFLKYIITDKNFGVAFGKESGKFGASYFSLTGSAKAIMAAQKMLSTQDEGKKRMKNQGVDEVL